MVHALVGLTVARSGVVWPQADAEFSEREGWVRGTIAPSLDGPKYVVDAMVRGDLAVHRMIGRDSSGWIDVEGWTISTIEGLRITYGARVFATCLGATKVAEQMGTENPAWVAWAQRGTLPDEDREKLRLLFEKAEADGEILRSLVTVNV
ncbi:hypothetical protein OIU34_19350 [Pararhizobium sp. BT-229]|uniref:hypothetical protein n=1 Tax=Pararhizobium sp. BT-229 TaxID=2986923 RepID=UPI0021F6F1DF|nr:hypothetical protein [Pararhizobium sp. BT-229]MCV9964040.1 hypothetical protein [Pararhizobium sp. BT-229]